MSPACEDPREACETVGQVCQMCGTDYSEPQGQDSETLEMIRNERDGLRIRIDAVRSLCHNRNPDGDVYAKVFCAEILARVGFGPPDSAP